MQFTTVGLTVTPIVETHRGWKIENFLYLSSDIYEDTFDLFVG